MPRPMLVALMALLAVAAVVAGCGGDEGARTTTGPRAVSPPPADGDTAGRWPGARWRPYGEDSPFNRPVTARDRVHPASSAIVSRILAFGLPADITVGIGGSTADFEHPVYFARDSDPVVRLQAAGPWGPSPVDGAQIHVPRGARAAGGTDGHLAVVQPDGWEYDLWQAGAVPDGGGTLPFTWGGRLRLDGDGIGGGATAADFGLLAGIVRPEELAAGRIDHALFLVVRCTSDTLDFGAGVQPHPPEDLGSSFVPPARKGGDRCAPDQADAPPMGARLRLAMSDEEIAALHLPRWKRAIVTALARYGGYVGDTGGAGFGVMTMSGASYTALGAADPWVALARHAKLPPAADGTYRFDVASGIDWAGRLQVLLPPSAQ